MPRFPDGFGRRTDDDALPAAVLRVGSDVAIPTWLAAPATLPPRWRPVSCAVVAGVVADLLFAFAVALFVVGVLLMVRGRGGRR
jgi:hypothetical protein